MKNEEVKKVLKDKWNWYFGRDHILNGVSNLNGIPTDVYREYLEFLIIMFRQDVMFDYLYKKYEKYIKNNTNNNYYLNEKSFEKHLSDFGLKTYLIMDEKYNLSKYVCYEPYIKIRKDD